MTPRKLLLRLTSTSWAHRRISDVPSSQIFAQSGARTPFESRVPTAAWHLIGGPSHAQSGRRFTAVYLMANNAYAAVVYGAVLGFVVYLMVVLAARLGVAGALVSTSAVLWPAIVVIAVWPAMLSYGEDERAL